jgi:flavin-dependent thymidylate synthase
MGLENIIAGGIYMKINLAGYNVDTNVLKELKAHSPSRDDITPEVLSASYARISRDPRDIDAIRMDARNEVEKSRKSNSTIIFKMGHHSVAEHAVFNLDIIGASRLIMEEIEKFRLCSYTEKSQRYITLDNDFVVPPEITGSSAESSFNEMIAKQNEAYFVLYERLKDYIFDQNADLAKDKKNHSLLDGWAKEDARYITALATESQVGLTVNARNLELMLRRFASHPLKEVQTLGKMIYDQVVEIAPSIIIFNEANDRDIHSYANLKKVTQDLFATKNIKEDFMQNDQEVDLVDYTFDGDAVVAAALLHTSSGMPYQECEKIAKELSNTQRMDLFKTAFARMQFYDSMLREFEYVNLTYNLILSSACFGQLKRHRMATLTSQAYDPLLGNTIPQSIKAIGMEDYFQKIVDQTNQVYRDIKERNPLVAPYILTNSHRKRALIRVNARELYHISRLREDQHAQWDIRQVTQHMSRAAKHVMPQTFALIGGKDRYNSVYHDLFGHQPKVTEAVLPGTRTIK